MLYCMFLIFILLIISVTALWLLLNIKQKLWEFRKGYISARRVFPYMAITASLKLAAQKPARRNKLCHFLCGQAGSRKRRFLREGAGNWLYLYNHVFKATVCISGHSLHLAKFCHLFIFVNIKDCCVTTFHYSVSLVTAWSYLFWHTESDRYLSVVLTPTRNCRPYVV